MCHLWPGYTLEQVWRMPYMVWLAFAAEVDAYHKALREQTKSKGGARR